MRVLNEKIVQCHAVAGGVDTRVDDIATRDMDAAGDPVEQARLIGCVDGDQRRPALRIDIARNCKVGFSCIEHELRILGDDVVGLGDPVRIGKPLGELPEFRFRQVKRFRQNRLLLVDPLFAPALLVAEQQHFLRCLEQIGQQLPFPAVPDAGSNRANIDHRQDQKLAEPFDAFHLAGKILDSFEIRQIPLESNRRHQQMVADQPCHKFGFVRLQPQSRAEFHRDFRAQYAVVAAAALGNIVQQGGDKYHSPVLQFFHRRGAVRMIGCEISSSNPG